MSELVEIQVTRVGMPAWAIDPGWQLGPDAFGGQVEWHFATPWAFQALASPRAFRPFIAAPRERDPHEQHRGYWATLLYLLLYRLGWADPVAGLAWWADEGFPADDPTLRFVRAVWVRDGRLPYLQAWLEQQRRPFLSEFEQLCGYRPLLREPKRFGDSNSEVQQGLGPAGLHLEPGGGRNHVTAAMEGSEADAVLLHSTKQDHHAMLAAKSMVGWYGALAAHGRRLPEIGNSSWHVDVYVEPVGFLGRFRRSRSSGIWFSGRHSIHEAGI